MLPEKENGTHPRRTKGWLRDVVPGHCLTFRQKNRGSKVTARGGSVGDSELMPAWRATGGAVLSQSGRGLLAGGRE